jgi:hypothetical protein
MSPLDDSESACWGGHGALTAACDFQCSEDHDWRIQNDCAHLAAVGLHMHQVIEMLHVQPALFLFHGCYDGIELAHPFDGHDSMRRRYETRGEVLG